MVAGDGDVLPRRLVARCKKCTLAGAERGLGDDGRRDRGLLPLRLLPLRRRRRALVGDRTASTRQWGR